MAGEEELLPVWDEVLPGSPRRGWLPSARKRGMVANSGRGTMADCTCPLGSRPTAGVTRFDSGSVMAQPGDIGALVGWYNIIMDVLTCDLSSLTVEQPDYPPFRLGVCLGLDVDKDGYSKCPAFGCPRQLGLCHRCALGADSDQGWRACLSYLPGHHAVLYLVVG
jgi:hypothetical protein